MYEAQVLADSRNPDGARLTTVRVVFPRFLLAELNTHRTLSRNSQSSRAVPTERLIDQVAEDPFVPEFTKRVKGMGFGEPLDPADAKAARRGWLDARDAALDAAAYLVGLDVDKSRVNRLLEPFLWHSAIVSATDWDNFFELRCPPSMEVTNDFPAQPEFQELAIEMKLALDQSTPRQVGWGDWHLPLVDGRSMRQEGWSRVEVATASAGRCARVSYDRDRDSEDFGDSYERGVKLQKSKHFSPFEHQAAACSGGRWGNFRGWKQFRKMLPGEEDQRTAVFAKDPVDTGFVELRDEDGAHVNATWDQREIAPGDDLWMLRLP